MANVAREHSLGTFLYLGKGEEMGAGREKASLLANALEAVLGAIYLDRGFKKAYKVIGRIALELLRARTSIDESCAARMDIPGFEYDPALVGPAAKTTDVPHAAAASEVSPVRPIGGCSTAAQPSSIARDAAPSSTRWLP